MNRERFPIPWNPTLARGQSEKSLLEIIRRSIRRPAHDLEVGMGDDCAVGRWGGGRARRWLLTTDMLQQGVHFLPECTTPFLLGYKSLAVNVSDIAGSAGMPLFYVVSLSLPAADPRFVSSFYAGLEKAGSCFGTHLAGGDLVRSTVGVVVNIALLGRTVGRKAVLRRGAQPGDLLCVTGRLGLAAIGLDLLLAGYRPLKETERAVRRGALIPRVGNREGWRRRCVLAHLAPNPPVVLAAALGESGLVSAMMDISDGLSLDLHRLCEASGCGAEVEEGTIPVCPEKLMPAERQRCLELHGGEDYGLLLTVPARKWPRLQALTRRFPRESVTAIGTITPHVGQVILRSGKSVSRLAARGYDHFSQ